MDLALRIFTTELDVNMTTLFCMITSWWELLVTQTGSLSSKAAACKRHKKNKLRHSSWGVPIWWVNVIKVLLSWGIDRPGNQTVVHPDELTWIDMQPVYEQWVLVLWSASHATALCSGWSKRPHCPQFWLELLSIKEVVPWNTFHSVFCGLSTVVRTPFLKRQFAVNFHSSMLWALQTKFHSPSLYYSGGNLRDRYLSTWTNKTKPTVSAWRDSSEFVWIYVFL